MRRDLVSPVEGKVVYYRPDGTGRDTYIKHDNGGLLSHDAVHRLKPKPEPTKDRMFFGKVYERTLPPKHQNRFPHYVSDGSGRDFYVTHNQGGNSQVPRWRDQVDYKFNHSLRKYGQLRQMDPEKQDVFTLSQLKMTKPEALRNRTVSQQQFGESLRLSRPKTLYKPPPIQSYFTQQFNSNRQSRLCEHAYH